MALFTSYVQYVCLHPSLSCFSIAVILLFAASLDNELIFLLFETASQKQLELQLSL